MILAMPGLMNLELLWIGNVPSVSSKVIWLLIFLLSLVLIMFILSNIELRLENNSIGERGVESLMTYLIENSAIESIYFTENPVSIQMLRTCGSEVNFSGNYLSPFNSIAYMMLLTSGNAPEDLIISLKLNDVCLSGLDPAGRGMRTSRPCFLLGHLSETVAFIKFKQLHLSGNNLSFLEVSALLEGLVSSTSLQILDLSRNRLDTKSSEKIISMLGDGGLCNLDRLELGDNPGLLSGPTSGTSWGITRSPVS